MKAEFHGARYDFFDFLRERQVPRQSRYVYPLPNLRVLLSWLENTIKEPNLRSHPILREHFKDVPLIWPTRQQLDELDARVFDLVESKLNRKKPCRWDEAYALVEERWPGLHLVERIVRLVKRARKNRTPRPVPNKACRHFDKIAKLAGSNTSLSASAQKFIVNRRKLRSGTMKLWQVDWIHYYDLLKGDDETVIRLKSRLPLENQQAICCIKYLELEHEYSRWIGEINDWFECQKVETAVFEWIEQNDLRDEGLTKSRLTRRGTGAKDRQRRHRQKKRLQKSVTSNTLKGRKSGDMRDAAIFFPHEALQRKVRSVC